MYGENITIAIAAVEITVNKSSCNLSPPHHLILSRKRLNVFEPINFKVILPLKTMIYHIFLSILIYKSFK